MNQVNVPVPTWKKQCPPTWVGPRKGHGVAANREADENEEVHSLIRFFFFRRVHVACAELREPLFLTVGGSWFGSSSDLERRNQMHWCAVVRPASPHDLGRPCSTQENFVCSRMLVIRQYQIGELLVDDALKCSWSALGLPMAWSRQTYDKLPHIWIAIHFGLKRKQAIMSSTQEFIQSVLEVLQPFVRHTKLLRRMRVFRTTGRPF